MFLFPQLNKSSKKRFLDFSEFIRNLISKLSTIQIKSYPNPKLIFIAPVTISMVLHCNIFPKEHLKRKTRPHLHLLIHLISTLFFIIPPQSHLKTLLINSSSLYSTCVPSQASPLHPYCGSMKRLLPAKAQPSLPS